jgi:hypothetical protein
VERCPSGLDIRNREAVFPKRPIPGKEICRPVIDVQDERPFDRLARAMKNRCRGAVLALKALTRIVGCLNGSPALGRPSCRVRSGRMIETRHLALSGPEKHHATQDLLW